MARPKKNPEDKKPKKVKKVKKIKRVISQRCRQ